MSGSARLISSQVIKTLASGISVGWAKQTTSWNRVYCSAELQNEFASVVEANESQLPAGTKTVSMKLASKMIHSVSVSKNVTGNLSTRVTWTKESTILRSV